MKKKIFTIMLCCGVLSSFSQHIQKDISGLTYLDKGPKVTVVSNTLRGDKPTPEELLVCPKNSVKSGEFVNEGFVGHQSSDQGRPGFHSKFFQSFTDNYLLLLYNVTFITEISKLNKSYMSRCGKRQHCC